MQHEERAYIVIELKPWMNQRDGESTWDTYTRLYRSCYKCGIEMDNKAELNAHEDTCGKWRKERT